MLYIHIPTPLGNVKIPAASIRNMSNNELISLVESHDDPLVRHLAKRLNKSYGNEREFEDAVETAVNKEIENYDDVSWDSPKEHLHISRYTDI